MIHRLGMYYLAVQLQRDQDTEAACRKWREVPDRRTVADPEDLAMLLAASAAVATTISAVAFVFWIAA